MIRLVFRSLGLLLCIAVLAGLGRLAHSTWIEFGSMRSEDGIRLDQSDLSLIYEVPRFQWIEFPAPGAQRVVRVIAHADVPREVDDQPDRIFQFLIRARFVDAGGVVLGERSMRFRTRIVVYRDLDTGELYRRAFYSGGGPQPTSTQETRLGLPGTEVHSIQFQLVEADPDISAVQLRLYKREPPAEHRLEKAWERLSVRTRNMLASGNLYPVEFLTAREKVNLVRNRWKPAGPRGVEGEDYRVREMRVYRSRSGEPAGDAQAGTGEYVARWLNLPIRITESGRLRLQFESASGDGAETRESQRNIAATLYREAAGEPVVSLIPLSAEGSATLEVEPGLLDLQFGEAGYVRAYLGAPSKLEQELVLERIAARNYFLNLSEPTRFPVRHAGSEGTTLRVDLACRCFSDRDAAPPQDASARYRVLSAEGSILQEGEIRNPIYPSRYAYARLSEPTQITDSSRFMIHLPEQAASVEWFGDSSVMVSVFSRPRDMPRRVRVSGDDAEQAGDALRRIWFPLRPSKYEAVRNSARSSMVFRGAAPPEPDLERLSGAYQWERFEPEGDWVGRYLLEPREEETETASRSLAAVFRPVQPNQDIELQIRGAGISSTVPMRIIVRRSSTRSVPMRLWVDGQLRWRGRVTGKNGEFSVGRIATGKHTLRVEIPGAPEVMINHTGSGATGFSKRLAIRVRQSELEIPFEKATSGKEVLSGIVYFPASLEQGVRLRADINGLPASTLRMFESSTVPGSELELVGSGGPAVSVLNSTDAPALIARRFYLPLGEDLPVGRYRIRLVFDSTAHTYLILSRSLPGAAPTRFLRHESLGLEEET